MQGALSKGVLALGLIGVVAGIAVVRDERSNAGLFRTLMPRVIGLRVEDALEVLPGAKVIGSGPVKRTEPAPGGVISTETTDGEPVSDVAIRIYGRYHR